MATYKQRKAAQKNIKKAQLKWKSMTSREHSLAQPEGRKRAKPGTKGTGNYYRVVVRPKNQFTAFRAHDVGRRGHLQRLAGKRSSGSWDTQAWLISKKDAYISNNKLVAVSLGAKKLIAKLGSIPKRIKGDIFEAKPTPNIPEREKPTKEQRIAQKRNIRKAQKVRWFV